MKITRIETFPVVIPLKAERRMRSALGQHIISKYVLVRVSTDVGIEGVGEATVMERWSGETVWGTVAIIDNVFAPLLIGCDPHDIDAVNEQMEKAAAFNWFAKSALEMTSVFGVLWLCSSTPRSKISMSSEPPFSEIRSARKITLPEPTNES